MGHRTGTGSFSEKEMILKAFLGNDISKLTDHNIVFPSCIIRELNPGADCVEVILGEDNSFTEANDVVMSGYKVMTLIVHLAETRFYKIFLASRKVRLPSVHGESGHHVARVPLLHTDVDHLPPPAHVGVPLLDDVGGVDDDVGVNVGRVDPLASEVLGQQTSRLNGRGSDRNHLHPNGSLHNTKSMLNFRVD